MSVYYPTFFNFKNVAHCFVKQLFQNLFHVDDALGIFEKLTIVPESDSITDDIEIQFSFLAYKNEETMYFIHTD